MKILITIWADPRFYLATIFSAQVLSKKGNSIDLIYRKPNSDMNIPGDIDFGNNSRLWPIGRGSTSWLDKIDYFKFIIKAIKHAWKEKPEIVIGYDMHGIVTAYFVTLFCPNTKLIYHNFDFEVSTKFGLLRTLLRRIEMVAARRADLIIFPASGRAKEYKLMAGLSKEPLCVLNCYPISWPQKKTGELDKILENKGLNFDRLVVRLGTIGPAHAIEATIRSVLEWEGNWGLIMAGVSNGSYLEDMQKLVDSLGLSDRVIILRSVSFSLWYDCLYSAHLGVSLYESGSLSNNYMAGTSQKLNNYFVAGIPSIVSSSSDFISFAEKYGTSVVVDATDPHSIARAVNELLLNQELYVNYCLAVKHAFESEFNFEKQFEPVFRRLVELSNGKP
jgi:glycosyltransferase involved in cell wall biosynthesis